MSANDNSDTPAIAFDVDNGYHKFTSDELAIMERLKERMKDFDHIRFQTDNMFLAKYLRAFDWNIEKSIDTMQRIYRMRKEHPEWFALNRVSDYMDLLHQKHRYMLADRDKHGRRIFVYKLGNARPETTLLNMAQIDDIWFECMLIEHETQLNGMVVLMDCADIPWSILKWCHPKLVSVGAERSDLFPMKHLEIHFINQSTILTTISQMVRPLLSKKLMSKVRVLVGDHLRIDRSTFSKFHFHKKGFDQLNEQLGHECLPEEYGGPAGATVDHEFGYRFLLKYEDFIFNNNQYGIVSSV